MKYHTEYGVKFRTDEWNQGRTVPSDGAIRLLIQHAGELPGYPRSSGKFETFFVEGL
jgi:hypothetical protein